MQEEIWKDVFGYEGLYEVSNLGRIKQKINNYTGEAINEIKKIIINNKGTPVVCLYQNGRSKTVTLARIVYKAFNLEFDVTDFNIRVLHKNGDRSNCKLNNLYVESRNFGRRVICITTNKIFESVYKASKYYDCVASSIRDCCLGIQKITGILDDGTFLMWMYLDEYEKTTKEEVELKKSNYNINSYRGNKIKGRKGGKRKVVCITTCKSFKSVTEASKYYNIDRAVISNCCLGKQKSGGKLKNGTRLVWEYLND